MQYIVLHDNCLHCRYGKSSFPFRDRHMLYALGTSLA